MELARVKRELAEVRMERATDKKPVGTGKKADPIKY